MNVIAHIFEKLLLICNIFLKTICFEKLKTLVKATSGCDRRY